MDARQPVLLTLRVRDLGRALAFWHEALGLPVRLRAGGLAELQSETVRVVLLEDGAAGPSSGGASAGTPGPAIGWETEDLDADVARLAERGIACEAVPPPPGVPPEAHGRRVGFRDPDGHRLELVTWA